MTRLNIVLLVSLAVVGLTLGVLMMSDNGGKLSDLEKARLRFVQWRVNNPAESK